MLNDLRTRFRARLIADVRRAHRLWSVRLSALGAGLSAAWTALPPDTRLSLPAGQWIGLALFLAIGLARIVDQPETRK
ncbi:hypothetical protein FHS91_000378 [Sphingobium xanthum]|jgi:hypothetical protein|uniref:DUF7940 domain-containing protein n=1 Tax=Sphingobium xanthum TaxID=1387165 RepID=UPI001C8BDEFC|nr:hypothetical protein [Sphingobium xanthum]